MNIIQYFKAGYLRVSVLYLHLQITLETNLRANLFLNKFQKHNIFVYYCMNDIIYSLTPFW